MNRVTRKNLEWAVYELNYETFHIFDDEIKDAEKYFYVLFEGQKAQLIYREYGDNQNVSKLLPKPVLYEVINSLIKLTKIVKDN